uniref:Uncharacterized protein n=1 Tax=Lepeophtheirus salmonis TaxID=72036 RepID=A0A0K2T676_LEPSM
MYWKIKYRHYNIRNDFDTFLIIFGRLLELIYLVCFLFFKILLLVCSTTFLI